MRYKALLMAAGIVSASALQAQSVEDGKKMLYYERYNSAEDILAKSINADPNNGAAWYTLTQTFLAQDKKASADSLMNAAPASLAGDPLVKIAKGQLLLMDGKKDEANKLFDEAIGSVKKKDQGEMMIKVARAHVDAKEGDTNKALALLTEAEGKEKKNPELHMTRGDAYRKLANGGAAIEGYMAALSADGKYARAPFMIGKIYLSQDNKTAYVENFEKAVEIDPNFKPALYELYYFNYFRDVNKAKDYLEKYIAASDPSPEHDYIRTDLMFVSRQYDEAIAKAQQLISAQGANAEPRLYKLIAYSYDAKKDSLKAKELMTTYFEKQPEDKRVPKDYEFMGNLLQRFPGEEVTAAANLEKAVALDTSAVEKTKYIENLSNLYKKLNDHSKEAYWMGEAYKLKKDPTNTDLYNWGSAHYFAKEFQKADSVFGVYTAKYPDQVYGPYWQARSNAAIDTSMEQGLAVPHYTKLIEVASKDTAKNKALLIQSYGYLAAYNANVAKDYAKAVEHLDQILVLQPENNDAKANKEILQKLVNTQQNRATGDSTQGGNTDKTKTDGSGGNRSSR